MIRIRPRPLAQIPVGALVMLPFFGVPLLVWYLETGSGTRPGCLFKTLWDLPCLSCGGTRATVALLDGRVLDAFLLQPLIIVIYIVVAVWGIMSLWAFLTRRSLVLDLSRRQDLVLKAAIISSPIVNWIYLWKNGI